MSRWKGLPKHDHINQVIAFSEEQRSENLVNLIFSESLQFFLFQWLSLTSYIIASRIKTNVFFCSFQEVPNNLEANEARIKTNSQTVTHIHDAFVNLR